MKHCNVPLQKFFFSFQRNPLLIYTEQGLGVCNTLLRITLITSLLATCERSVPCREKRDLPRLSVACMSLWTTC